MGDVFLPSFEQGMDCALDVTVVSSLQQALLAKAWEEPGSALSFAFNRKMRQSRVACRQEGIKLIPLAFECLGGLHDTTISTVTKLGRALAAHSERPESEVISQLFQRLRTLLAKGNSDLLLSRPPRHVSPDLDEDDDPGYNHY